MIPNYTYFVYTISSAKIQPVFAFEGYNGEFVEFCAQSKIRFAVARLKPVRAGEAFERLEITYAVHRDHSFHSVDEAIRALAKKTNEFPDDKE